ncbi:MAG: site-specific tyrosine recombinase XerD [Flavobacteriaceae bacterium]|nr:site-specific tyrosine recombinase XerD [Flavobacteriaceae bacterium]
MYAWKSAITDFSLYLKLERNLSNNSIKAYERDVKKLYAWIESNSYSKTSPENIQAAEIQEFLYQKAKELKVKSQMRLVSSLRGFFEYLVYEKYRTHSPMEIIDAPKAELILPDVLSLDEINRMIDCIDVSTANGQRNRAIIECLYGCGLRVSELTDLKISDLFFEEGVIKVTGKGNKQRFVPINTMCVKHIEIYRTAIRNHQKIDPAHSDTLFLNNRGKGLTRAMIFHIIKQIKEQVGINKKVSPHTFRHSFATHLLENGADLRSIQAMLGHESITTTEIYTHIDRNQLKKVLEKYHPRAFN